MNVIAVLVDELPEGCLGVLRCPFVRMWNVIEGEFPKAHCTVIHRLMPFDECEEERMPGCPLLKVQDWHGEKLSEL